MKFGDLFLVALSATVCLEAASGVPELAQRGQYAVGVRTLNLLHKGQPDILHFDAATGKAPLYDRPLTLEVWYPAVRTEGQVETTVYEMAGRDPQTTKLSIAGKAIRDAAPLSGTPFPLVVLSHGYPGSRIFLSYLGEHLASRGYIVASIDHTDSVLGAVRAFPSTLLNRSSDQLFVLSEMVANFKNIDAERAAIVGYSMGGYGALASAGAGYNKQGGAIKMVQGGYLEEWSAGNAAYRTRLPKNLKAVVAIAPWGEQPPNKNWDAEGLAGIHIPSLFIAGDHDDIADFERGIKPAFEGAVNSNRCLLVYENARHNTGGNPPPPGLTRQQDIDFFDEAVWNKEHLAAINQHFITAFLDLYLKGDEAKRAYLDEPSRGFEKRWALGFTLQCKPAAH
jgi:predicted dienelactone hydrolase